MQSDSLTEYSIFIYTSLYWSKLLIVILHEIRIRPHDPSLIRWLGARKSPLRTLSKDSSFALEEGGSFIETLAMKAT